MKIVGSILLFYLAIYIVLFVRASPKENYNTTLPTGSKISTFNSKVWKNDNSTEWKTELLNDQKESSISAREKMLHDLLYNILPNKNKSEIESILGLSLKTDYFSSMDYDLIYYLGPQRDGYIMNIDSEWLLIFLDNQNKFHNYRIMND